MRIKLKGNLIIALILLFILLVMTACTNFGYRGRESKDNVGLQIYSMSTGLGAVSKENTDQHHLTYIINLSNEDAKDVDIKWIEPVLGKGIKDRVEQEDLRLVIEKTIPVKGALKIEGMIIFNTLNLSKEDIIALEPFITGIKVGSEKTIIIEM